MVLVQFVILLIILSSVNCLTDEEIGFFKSQPVKAHDSLGYGRIEIGIPSDSSDSKYLTIKSNGLPDHPIGARGKRGNRLVSNIHEHDFSYVIPRSPKTNANYTYLPMGIVGFAINGVAIYSSYTSKCCDAGLLESFDECNGHPNSNKIYHYHIAPKCLYDGTRDTTSSGIIGVALDGFPIYGPDDVDGNEIDPKELDECNGRKVDGHYRYHVTGTFPYIFGCFAGTPEDPQVKTEAKCKGLGTDPSCDN